MAKPWGIKVDVIDVQSTEVRDVRMDELYENLNDVKDVMLEKILADLYKHLDDFSYNSRLSYEFFLFRGKCSEQTLHENVAYLIATASNGNYRGFKNLSKLELEELVMNLYGLEDLKVKDMIDLVAAKSNTKSIRFLWVANEEGKRKVLNEAISGINVVEQYDYEIEEQEEERIVPELENVENELLDIFVDDIEVGEQETFTQVLRKENKVESVDTIDLFGSASESKPSKKASKKVTKSSSKKEKIKEEDKHTKLDLF